MWMLSATGGDSKGLRAETCGWMRSSGCRKESSSPEGLAQDWMWVAQHGVLQRDFLRDQWNTKDFWLVVLDVSVDYQGNQTVPRLWESGAHLELKPSQSEMNELRFQGRNWYLSSEIVHELLHYGATFRHFVFGILRSGLAKMVSRTNW